MWDLMLPWQQMHRHSGTCNKICLPCEPRRSYVHKSWGGSDVDDPFLNFLSEIERSFFAPLNPAVMHFGVVIAGKHVNTHSRADTIKPSIQEERDRIICSVSTGNSVFSLLTSLIVSVKKENWNLASLYCRCCHEQTLTLVLQLAVSNNCKWRNYLLASLFKGFIFFALPWVDLWLVFSSKDFVWCLMFFVTIAVNLFVV